ncbi:outer membrane protein OmpA-like peptidoglycan-associated protein [Hymenobacter luteus]|uniref:Outer membrane protein OmpA-like peptidoglycan-associated protein n=2 Tax=Hymenobacter TaxID=89966 RepID=A0A7W9SX15_9BACT|nr:MULTISPECIES: OmpA family protein [Hymenobacter]MBB4600228.1 outer membrane protein OmpA-like peptidoglycan-associated protein [Hymenobacter latericoloratus]MBB6057462.1 outer membrane protein OmpA-like peptidoglycan-associated protein [Hymenobacter luteus]
MRHLLTTSTALGLTLLAAAPKAQAQTADRRTAIGLNVSAMQYKGNFGSDYWKWSENKYAPGITISRYLSSGLDLQLSGNYVELKKNAPAGAPYFGSNFATNVVNVNLGLKLKLNNGWALKEDAFIQPYLLAAPGLTYTSREGTIFRNNQSINTDQDKSYFDLFGAAGINFRLGEGVGLFVQTGQHIPLNANLDGDPARDDNKWDDKFLQHTVGLNFALGKAKDTDNDGVSDRKDKCPDTPAGVSVDENGCPLDGDKDGVPDYQDQCPTEAGTAAMQGCPDRDNDGVADKDDQCPDQAGLPALRGCPDADGDGVADQNDKCPGTPAGTQVDANGCPLVVDADGDGVPDNADKCPDTPRGARVDANGCPMEIDPGVRKLEQPIRFETNSTVIKRTSYGTLDKMVKALNDHPEYSLRVIGHADSRGTDEYNQALSERRAGSVKRYFTGKQVDPARIVTEGRGESEPAAPNTSSKNMSQNRRVEFKFEFFIPNAPQP